MCRAQYVRLCLFGPRVSPRFSHHLFSGIYTRSAAAVIKANSVVQGHTTAFKEREQLCVMELFGSLCLCVGSQVNVIGSRSVIVTPVAERLDWFEAGPSIAAAVIVKIKINE